MSRFDGTAHHLRIKSSNGFDDPDDDHGEDLGVQAPLETRPWSRRPRARLSVRAFLIVVLIAGGGLGWLVHGARVQREAVAAIERGRGDVRYDCQGPASFKKSLATWMWRRLGSRGRDYWDYLFDVVYVGVRDDPGRTMDEVAQLGRLKQLSFECAEVDFRQVAEDDDRQPYLIGASLEKLEGLTGLERLSFDVAPLLTDADLAHLEGLTALRVLQLPASSGCQVTDAGLVHLEGLTALSFLDLEKHARLTSAGLAHLRGMTRLNQLWMSGTRVDDLTPIAHLAGLMALRLDGTPITDAGLAPVAGFTRPATLSLAGTPITDAGLAHLRNLARLKSLRLDGTHVTDAGLSHLAGLASLQHLYLADTCATDAALVRLAGLSSLTSLGLYGTKVTDEGLAHLAAIRPLTRLNLGKTRVTDAGLVHLAGLGSLAELNVVETRITAAGLQRLAGLPGLKELVIGGDQGTDAEIAALREARPGLQVLDLLPDGTSDGEWRRREP